MPPLDKRAVRHAFERAAGGYDAAAVLQHEVCRRMAERLQLIRLTPLRVLDAGCGTGYALPLLRERFPTARVLALDLAPAMLRVACARAPWWKRFLGQPVTPLCGDIEALPLKNGSIDLAWSNLALQWMDDLPQALAELHRVLAPGGLLMFSTFGPDTLKELRAAYTAADVTARAAGKLATEVATEVATELTTEVATEGVAPVNRFIDLHDIGDMLVKCGYADPVMDMEPFTLTYDNARAVMRDLKAIGATTVAAGRRQGLAGKARLAAVEAAYELMRRDSKLPATFEVIYGHAWKPQPRVTANGKKIIEIKASHEH